MQKHIRCSKIRKCEGKYRNIWNAGGNNEKDNENDADCEEDAEKNDDLID